MDDDEKLAAFKDEPVFRKMRKIIAHEPRTRIGRIWQTIRLVRLSNDLADAAVRYRMPDPRPMDWRRDG